MADLVFRLSAFVPLRQRYVLTRRNKLRLRYAVGPAMAMALLAGTVIGSAVSHTAQTINQYQVASDSSVSTESYPENIEDRYAAMQRRLQRYDADSAGITISPEAERLAAVVKAEPLLPRDETIEIGSGDTLAGVLQQAGLSGNDAYQAVLAMKEHYDPRQIRPGQKLNLHFSPSSAEPGTYDFARLSMAIDPLKTVNLSRGADGAFEAALVEKQPVRKTHARAAEIEVSLYGSGLKAGIPNTILAEAIRIYSWDIDFQRDIRRGDSLEVMFEQFETEDGQPVKSGDVIYARLKINGQDMPLYRYKDNDGHVDYYMADGSSIRKTLMSTPIDGARLSSGFGVRRHPVLGYTKMHKGVDFAAPRGTPIYAAGDGTVEKAGPFSSYGNYVRIRHNGSMKTAYAHMQRFAPGVKSGSRVKQGQIIGYVGTTGRSTGPHLHYEVMKNGVQVNPRDIKSQQGDRLTGKELAAFKLRVKDINREYQEQRGLGKLASAESGTFPLFN